MRYVDIHKKGPPDKAWLREAKEITIKILKAESAKEKRKIIKDNEDHWRKPEFKKWLLSLFHNKCWYTEAREDVSYYHVDHFRPKGRVVDGKKKRDGYYWLAFNWINYRIAGQILNVKKRDHFPVRGGFVASERDKRIDVEDTLLIDPTLQGDVGLVSFEGGEITYAVGISDHDKERVDVTRDIFGLNRIPTLVEARQKTWAECLEYIDNFQCASTKPRPLDSIARATAITELKKRIKEEEEYSAVAMACIRKYAPEPLISQVFS